MRHPILYEINTRCRLRMLSEREGRAVTLADVPDSEFTRWEKLGFTHIWLMGVWSTGPRCRALALNEPHLREVYQRVLPDWKEEDVAGSPYAIAGYDVPQVLGGESGIKLFRERLNARGLKLLLDFVPNHLGLDHPWAAARPELFVQATSEILGVIRQPTASGTAWLANGKDPYFAPWTDTIQLDYRRSDTRAAMVEQLQSIARRCDGVRCDMAMLVLNDVFQKTWAAFPGTAAAPAAEFWTEAIVPVKRVRSDFLFLAEAYWGMESRLQSLGFDFTYDKQVYDDLLAHRNAELQRNLLEAPPEQVARSAHFLENHDEQRIASVLSLEEHRAAALLVLGIPGMRFLHDGQLEGARIHVPVQLSRQPEEPVDSQIQAFYQELLAVLKNSAVGNGQPTWLRPEPAWEGNPTASNFVVVQWRKTADEFNLVAVNLAGHQGQCRVRLSVPGVADHEWELRDLLGRGSWRRAGSEMAGPGLLLDLPGHGGHLLLGRPRGS